MPRRSSSRTRPRQVVNQAIAANRILPAQKDYHLSAIKTHAGGIEQGIEAFNGFADGDKTKDATAVLEQRIAPSGAPRTRPGSPTYPTPNGWEPPGDERLELHAKIADHARKRGISYRDAVVEFGAVGA